MKEIYVGRNLKYLYTYPNYTTRTFHNMTSFTATIGKLVTKDSDGIFKLCTGLKSVTLEDGLTSIGKETFFGCFGLTSINIPKTVTSIEESVFNGCTGLTSIEISGSVTSIGRSAFYNCSKLTSIALPNSVTAIGDGAFGGCTGLERMEVENINMLYKIDFGNEEANPLYFAHHLYMDGKEVTELKIPDNVESIGAYAFIGGTGFRKLKLPSSLNEI